MRHEYRFLRFASENSILLEGVDSQAAARAAQLAIGEVERIEQKYSRYRGDSIVSQINEAAGSSPLRVDEETARLLDFAQLAYESSDGLFDITSGVLRRVWDFQRSIVPSTAALAEVLPLVGWNQVEWEPPFLRLLSPGMELDFGGIGKEYAVDRVAQIPCDSHISHALINFGGDIRAIGPREDGQSWQIGIRHPRSAKRTVATVDLVEGALATSGDYERSFTIDGHRYHHILNPRDGWPAVGPQSVTVHADACVSAGILATSAMLQGDANAPSFLLAAGVDFLIVSKNGEVCQERREDKAVLFSPA